MPDINVYDSSAVSDRAASAILADFEISIVEWTLPSELYWMPEITRTISKYESVSVADAGISLDGPGPEFGMEDRVSGYPRMPVRELYASFTPSFSLDAKMPQRFLQGSFGGSLDGKLPARSLSASFVTPSEYISVAGSFPTRSLEAAFGGFLSGKIPVRSLSAGFTVEGYFTLDKKKPVWQLSSELSAPRTFSLDAKMPVRTVSLSLEVESISLELDVKRPPGVLSASMLQDGIINLEVDIPARRLTSSIYDSGFDLDVIRPVWIIEEALDGKMSYSAKYTDYILRYIRP